MSTTVFLELPVSDLARSKRFYTDLGWELHPVLSGEHAGAVLIGGTEHVMVLSPDRHRCPLGGSAMGTPAGSSVVNAISVDSPEQVDTVVERALRAGATEGETQDYGFLRSRCFHDPDGHQWEVLWMDPEAQRPES